MKKIIVLLSFGLLSTGIFAQNFTHTGDQKLQAGFNFYGYGTGIKASYDYGIAQNFSIGAGIDFFNSGSYASTFFIFGRGDYHFGDSINLPDELDVYAGLELGLIGNSNFGIGGHAGARYELSDNWGAFVEVGNNGAIGLYIRL